MNGTFTVRGERQLIGTFGPETVNIPRARIEGEDGKTSEWRSKALPRYQRLTKKAEALIAAVYLSGTNTRRVKRALFGLFQGAVSKDVVSRAWRKVKTDWQAWCSRSLADEDIVRQILDGTVIKTRIDKKAGDKLFTFTRLPQSQWKSARTTNAIERLNEEFRRRVKTQTVLPCAETVPMLLWALMASGQIIMRKVDGWETLAQPVADATLDQAA